MLARPPSPLVRNGFVMDQRLFKKLLLNVHGGG